jgi:hypothetical protein
MSRIGAWVLALGLLAAPGWALSSPAGEAAPGQGEGDKTGKGKKKPGLKFTVGKETTYALGPLTRQGHVNYPAALNERLSKGVTPQNNANVLFWKALGPHPEGATMPDEFFKWLGFRPPEQGDYFLDLYRYAKKHLDGDPREQANRLDEQLDPATARPWKAKEHPQIAAWLKANEKPLAVVIEGTKRSHYFNPLTPKGDSGLIGALLPGVQKCREFANALAARAMLRTGEERYDQAWQDLLACKRLGRLVARGGTLIELLVGVAVDAIGSNADLAYLERAKLSAKQIQDRMRDLRRLPPMPAAADKVDLGERFMFLDSTLMVARGGAGALEGLAGGRAPKDPDPKVMELWKKIDWDPALRKGNQWYDRTVAAMRLKDRGAREKAMAKIEQDLKDTKAKLLESGDLAAAMLGLGPDAKALGRIMGDVLIGLLMPAIQKVQQAGDRAEQIQRNLHVAFALAAHKQEQGNYPAKLEALAPKYLPQVPGDLFSGKGLIYRPAGKGYLLYSVGANGKDEGGRTYDDDPAGDDLVVRMPLPELRRK